MESMEEKLFGAAAGSESVLSSPPFPVAAGEGLTQPPQVSATMVLWLTALMAAATGLGALPFFCVGALSKLWSALANSLACGVMLAASFDLIHEGEPYGPGNVILGVVLGTAFICASQRWLDQFEHVRFERLEGADARKVLLIVGIMAAHAFGEGSGVGVSFCGHRGWAQGLLVTVAIGLHNIPEGLAVAALLVAKGLQPRQALWWTLATSAPQPLLAVPSYLFVDSFRELLPVALGFAAGCMIWITLAELLPDALEDAPHSQVAVGATLAAASLEGMRMALAGLEGSGGREGSTATLGTGAGSAGALAALVSVGAAASAGGCWLGRRAGPRSWWQGAVALGLLCQGMAEAAAAVPTALPRHPLAAALGVVGGLLGALRLLRRGKEEQQAQLLPQQLQLQLQQGGGTNGAKSDLRRLGSAVGEGNGLAHRKAPPNPGMWAPLPSGAASDGSAAKGGGGAFGWHALSGGGAWDAGWHLPHADSVGRARQLGCAVALVGAVLTALRRPREGAAWAASRGATALGLAVRAATLGGLLAPPSAGPATVAAWAGGSVLGVLPAVAPLVPAGLPDGGGALQAALGTLACTLQAMCVGALPVLAVKLLAHTGFRKQALHSKALACACGLGAGLLLALSAP